MDIFRLLAKSTSLQKSASTSENATRQRIPSAGLPGRREVIIDYELISDVEKQPVTNSRKRKRGQNERDQALTSGEQLDFFRLGAEDALLSTKASGANNQWRQPNAGAKNENVDGNITGQSEETCKRVMKRHKLKVTLLDSEQDASGSFRSESSKYRKKCLTQLWVQPLTSFKQLRTRYGLSKRLAENLELLGYVEPTEVQLGSLPVLLGSDEDRGLLRKDEANTKSCQPSDVDLLTVAPTGSGKTLAFLIHIFHGLLKGFSLNNEYTLKNERVHYVQALIIVPTHELADQIAHEGKILATGTGLKIASMKKGMILNLEQQ